MSNIEEDKTKNFIKAYEEAKAQSFIIESINKDFFFEFADCLIARIKELEEKNKHLKYLYDDCCKCLLNTIEKQKVKDKIEELKKEYEIALEENGTKAFILKCKIRALEELLEEK